MKILDLNNFSVEILLILLFTFLSFACEDIYLKSPERSEAERRGIISHEPVGVAIFNKLPVIVPTASPYI